MFLANTHAQAESLLHRLEQAAKSIGLYVNADKTEFMHFNQDNSTSLLNNGNLLKLVEQFIHIDSNISSTEKNVNNPWIKRWQVIKLDLWWSKMGILQSSSRVNTIVWLHHSNFKKMLGEKGRWELHKDAVCYFEQIQEGSA